MTAARDPEDRGGSGFAELGGRRLEIRWIGAAAADRPTLVFLHEGLGSVSLWRDFPDRVAAAADRPALLYSRAGYGRSDPAVLPRRPDYLAEEALTVLPALLARLGIARYLLIGHSDGASIALLHAGGAPAAGLAGIVAMAPHVFNEALCIAGIEAAQRGYEAGPLRRRLARHHADVDHAFWGWNRIWLDPGFRDWTITGVLPAIRVPVLVIQGRQDEYGSLAQVDTIAAAVPGARTLLLDPCRHTPQRDQPERTLAAIVDFVRTAG